jgi:hypothetical protein
VVQYNEPRRVVNYFKYCPRCHYYCALKTREVFYIVIIMEDGSQSYHAILVPEEEVEEEPEEEPDDEPEDELDDEPEGGEESNAGTTFK